MVSGFRNPDQQVNTGIDLSTASVKVASKHMTSVMSEYNSRVPNNQWKIQGRNQTMMIALCHAPPAIISMLEDHYSTFRHTEGALTLDQLSFCEWRVGTSRIPEGVLNASPMWTMIMCVSSLAMEEFAQNLVRSSCWDWEYGHVMFLQIVGWFVFLSFVVGSREVRRAILDFSRKIGTVSAAKRVKLNSQMTKQQVMDLMDVCCVFVYVQAEINRQFGPVVMEQIRGLWLKGWQC